jgi:hypothetical protein
MANIVTPSSSSSRVILNEEIDRLVIICSHISQLASRIRLTHLSNISFSTDFIKSYHRSLLSMSEQVEGSAVLLQSLLALEQRKSVLTEPKKPRRFHYTREELLQLRQYVTSTLSVETKNTLEQVVDRESDNSINKPTIKSWRNIRTILA